MRASGPRAPVRRLTFATIVAALAAVLVRPWLWATALRQWRRTLRPRWWRRAPFLPVPDPGYVEFRLVTAYGATGRPRPEDLVAYLEWCRQRR